MGEAIGAVVSFGIAVSLNPLSIIAVVLILDSPRGRVNGPAFLLGWMAGLFAAGAIVVLLSSGASLDEGGASGDKAAYLRLVLAVLLIVMAKRQFSKRPAPGEMPEMPAWMKATERLGAMKTMGAGMLLAAANPKNLVLIAGAGAAISQTGSSTADQAVALAVFAVIGTVGPAVPVAIYFLLRERSEAVLAKLRDWMAREGSTIIGVICLIIAAVLIGDAISGLSA